MRPKATALLKGPVPVELRERIVRQIREFDMNLRSTSTSLYIDTPIAETEFKFEPTSLRVNVSAINQAMLHQARESASYMLEYLWPDCLSEMKWSGDANPDRTPPNFQLATVRSSRRLSENFQRVTLSCSDLALLQVGGMHFTLILPPPGEIPRWPTLNEYGRTQWPTDEDALHRAAYTFVAFDESTSCFDFDVFLHAGGRVPEWATTVSSGQEVGVMGPGGGDFPETPFLLAGGDETALPAIRRILEQAPPEQLGAVYLETGFGTNRQEVQAPDGVSVHWLERGTGSSLVDELEAFQLPEDDASSFVWIAAEQQAVRRLKKHFRNKGLSGQRSYFAIYWTAQ
ncbi:MAG: siderophore-interacting protein [Pseudomonadota bacterium]